MKFTIKKGAHGSNQWLYKLRNWYTRTGNISCRVAFDRDCAYDLGSPDQLDVNKLIGYSTSLHHHEDSVRFGWRSAGELIELFAYSYLSEERLIEKIAEVPLETEVWLAIRKDGNDYLYQVEHPGGLISTHVLERHLETEPSYMLWPYFGGNCRAPHNMSITIKDLKK